MKLSSYAAALAATALLTSLTGASGMPAAQAAGTKDQDRTDFGGRPGETGAPGRDTDHLYTRQ